MDYRVSSWGIILLLFFFVNLPANGAAKAQNMERKVTIFEVRSDEGKPDPAKTHSVRYITRVAGVPFIITPDIKKAAEYSVIIATEGFDGLNLTDSERATITEYVQNGGVLITTNLKDPSLFDLAGISDEQFSTSRFSIHFDISKSESVFKWIDEPNEIDIPIANKENAKAIFSRSYQTNNADVLGIFDDGTPAFIRNKFGKGFVYTFGNSFKDLILHNQLNFDFTTNRTYSNGFDRDLMFLTLFSGEF